MNPDSRVEPDPNDDSDTAVESEALELRSEGIELEPDDDLEQFRQAWEGEPLLVGSAGGIAGLAPDDPGSISFSVDEGDEVETRPQPPVSPDAVDPSGGDRGTEGTEGQSQSAPDPSGGDRGTEGQTQSAPDSLPAPKASVLAYGVLWLLTLTIGSGAAGVAWIYYAKYADAQKEAESTKLAFEEWKKSHDQVADKPQRPSPLQSHIDDLDKLSQESNATSASQSKIYGGQTDLAIKIVAMQRIASGRQVVARPPIAADTSDPPNP